MEEILEQKLLIRGRVFATFSTIEKALAGRKKSFRQPRVLRRPVVIECKSCCPACERNNRADDRQRLTAETGRERSISHKKGPF